MAVKRHIRTTLGDNAVYNHVHKPDNPGETLCDIGHLAGVETLAALYRRFDRDHAADRLATGLYWEHGRPTLTATGKDR